MSKKPLKSKHKVQEESSLRPIGARALKSAIDTLRPELMSASVLDLYAGQGRFGVASAHEGISSVTFVEKNSRTAHALKVQCEAKSFPKEVAAKVLAMDVFAFLEKESQTYDIVFADPPFPEWNLSFESKLLQGVMRVLKPSAILLVKHPARVVASSEFKELKLWKQTEFGESHLLYYRYGKDE